jgi:hypothetical protein
MAFHKRRRDANESITTLDWLANSKEDDERMEFDKVDEKCCKLTLNKVLKEESVLLNYKMKSEVGNFNERTKNTTPKSNVFA